MCCYRSRWCIYWCWGVDTGADTCDGAGSVGHVLDQGMLVSVLVQLCVFVSAGCRSAPRTQGKAEKITWCTGKPVHRWGPGWLSWLVLTCWCRCWCCRCWCYRCWCCCCWSCFCCCCCYCCHATQCLCDCPRSALGTACCRSRWGVHGRR